jgi:hypothetical protein
MTYGNRIVTYPATGDDMEWNAHIGLFNLQDGVHWMRAVGEDTDGQLVATAPIRIVVSNSVVALRDESAGAPVEQTLDLDSRGY